MKRNNKEFQASFYICIDTKVSIASTAHSQLCGNSEECTCTLPETSHTTPNICFDVKISTVVTLDVNLMDNFVSDVQRALYLGIILWALYLL